MGVFENLPYTNFHELNLDWLVKKVKELETDPAAKAPVILDPKAVTTSVDISSPGVTSFFYQIGCMVVVNAELELLSDESGWDDGRVITGLPLPKGATNKELGYLSVPCLVDNGHFTEAYFSGNNADEQWALCIGGLIDTAGTLQEGDLVRINFTYITEDY